jgi:multidrug efflux system membrane fusion protein
VERIADHVTRFSLAGIASLRERRTGPPLMTFSHVRTWLAAHRGLAIAGAAGLVLLFVWIHRLRATEGPPAAPERPVPVAAEPARTGDVAVHLDGIGTVTPRAAVTVRTRVDGELVAVHFREGQDVARGDLLAEIDPRPFEVQLTQAEGQLARDQAVLANAKVDLKRYQALAKDDAIPTQQRDTQEALVRQAEAALAVDRGQIDAAQLNLVYSRITSPVDGRIGLRLVDPGNIVHASDAGGLAVVTQLRPIDVVFTIPEDAPPRGLGQGARGRAAGRRRVRSGGKPAAREWHASHSGQHDRSGDRDGPA